MKKILFIVLGVLIILTIGVFSYYKISPINIDTPNLPSQGSKILPFDDSSNMSSYLIGKAKEKISESESQLNKAKEKDLREFDLLHRKFLENMIVLMEDKLDESKDNLDKAKIFFENKEYFGASDHAYLSVNIASIIPRHTNNILEGRTKEQWNRLEAIETNS